MKEKERPAKENAGEGGGNGMLNEKKERQVKGNNVKGGRMGMLNEQGKASKERRMLMRAECMEFGMKLTER